MNILPCRSNEPPPNAPSQPARRRRHERGERRRSMGPSKRRLRSESPHRIASHPHIHPSIARSPTFAVARTQNTFVRHDTTHKHDTTPQHDTTQRDHAPFLHLSPSPNNELISTKMTKYGPNTGGRKPTSGSVSWLAGYLDIWLVGWLAWFSDRFGGRR